VKPVSIKRTSCRLCNSPKMSLEVQLPLTFIADKYASIPKQTSSYFPLDLYQCQNCGHVQVLDILPLEILFSSDYSYKPSRSQSLIQHFSDYASQFASELNHIPKKVLDIGSNDGLFLECLRDQYNCQILGIDPAEAPVLYARGRNIPTEHAFFNSESVEPLLSKYGLFDVISANNVFAHNDDLAGFASSVASALTENGIFCFEISYLVDIVEKTLIGTIFHEHLSHHSLIPLDLFLRKFGLNLFHVVPVSSQGGALQCFATKDLGRPASQQLKDLVAREEQLAVTSSAYMSKFRLNIAQLLADFQFKLNAAVNSSTRVIAYGAARSANLLIEQLQLSNRLFCILDGNPEKVGKFLFNSSTPILNATNFTFMPGDLVIPLAWIHSEAIYSRLQSDPSLQLTDVGWLQFHPTIEFKKFL